MLVATNTISMQQDTERIGQLCGCVFDSVEGGDYKWTIFKKVVSMK